MNFTESSVVEEIKDILTAYKCTETGNSLNKNAASTYWTVEVVWVCCNMKRGTARFIASIQWGPTLQK